MVPFVKLMTFLCLDLSNRNMTSKRLRKSRVLLKEKCKLKKSSISFIDHVDSSGIHVDPNKILAKFKWLHL